MKREKGQDFIPRQWNLNVPLQQMCRHEFEDVSQNLNNRFERRILSESWYCPIGGNKKYKRSRIPKKYVTKFVWYLRKTDDSIQEFAH